MGGMGRESEPLIDACALTENEISRHVVEASVEVHRALGGPGLLESVYEEALLWELQEHGLAVRR